MAKPVNIPNTFATQTGNIPVSQVDTNFTTLATALNDPATYSNYAVDGGVANAYVITLNPAPSTLASLAGVPIIFKAVHVNTGASTINVNGFGVTNIFKNVNVNLVAGDIPANGLVAIAYDGTNFQLLSSYTSASSGYYAVTSGTDTYTATLGLISYVTGTEYKLDFGNANTVTNPTLNIDSLGAKNILRFDGSALLVSDLLGQQTIIYDGTNMLVKNPRHILQGESLGSATATTQAAGDNTTKIATDAFVLTEIAGRSRIKGTKLLGVVGLAQATTAYLTESGQSTNGTQSLGQWICCRPVRIRDLYINSSANPPAGQTFTVTLQKNGVDTALTAQISNNVQSISDTTHTVDFGVGDKAGLKVVSSATSGTSSIKASIRHVDITTGDGLSVIPFSFTSSNTVGVQFGGGLNFAQNTAAYCHIPVCSADVFLENMIHQNPAADQGQLSITSGATTKAYYGMQVAASSSGIMVQSAISTDAGFYLPSCGILLDSAANYFMLVMQTATTARVNNGSYSLKTPIGPNIKAEVAPLYFSSINQAQATTLYAAGYGGSGNATEANVQVQVSAGTLKNFVFHNAGTGVAGQTWTANVRVNGATVATLILSGTSTYITDTVTTVAVNATDNVSVQIVSSATTGTQSVHFAMDHTN